MVSKASSKSTSANTSEENTALKSKKQPPDNPEGSHQILREGKARKLSPKSTNYVFYEIDREPNEGELYVRLVTNEGGGLHSKEWIKLTDVLDVLSTQEGKPFKSSVLRTLFSSTSANNAGFLAACLRDMELTIQSEKSVFLQVLAPDFHKHRDELLALSQQDSE
ncbi:hypothetical protein [Vibrio sp. B1FLJ16]|uniref:hypothetical protein n=1 Tax=Vibrio sp. B1FLJ16 TaxID=2751178 RepID=UPI0015F4402C|nr:hypothetical protein [Vibrio sp. B1FLJ16]CAD7798494.1 hypothetical protein ACOMICROBIO_EPCKBFOG_00352 [Vibrio sp. B1FLJ16]CAE6883848.1 hypothetical protein ACOMICROBIO_EPCKBFOG_00352 [Vibrio sp. B1FLJ16]